MVSTAQAAAEKLRHGTPFVCGYTNRKFPPETGFPNRNDLALDAFCRQWRHGGLPPCPRLAARNRRHRLARRHRRPTTSPPMSPCCQREDFDVEKPAQLADVLRRVAGVHVDQVGGRGGTGSLYLRGADPNYTLVLVDGVRVNDPTNARGGSFDFSTLRRRRRGARGNRARPVFGRVWRRCAGGRHQHRHAARAARANATHRSTPWAAPTTRARSR